MSNRCIELLGLNNNNYKLLLDIGCGSGISSNCINELNTEYNINWIGVDISKDMLNEANMKLNNIDDDDMSDNSENNYN